MSPKTTKMVSTVITPLSDGDVSLVSHPRPQEQVPSVQVSLRELIEQRQRFILWPDCQRDQVWELAKMQALIDTILKGDPIGSLEGFKDVVDGVIRWGIIDGHQRISAILDFADGVYKTWSEHQKQKVEPNSPAPIEPARFYDQLSAFAIDCFLDYHITINKVRKGTDQEIVERFLRLQNHTQVSAAEKLFAYGSKAKRLGKALADHPFWKQYYSGRVNRKQTYQSSLFLLAITTAYANMKIPTVAWLDLQVGPYIHGFAAGKLDHKIPDDILTRMDETFKKIGCLYQGTQFSERAIVVAMYQSVQFLELAGYTIDFDKDAGKLSLWIQNILDESKRTRNISHYNLPVQMLAHASGQRTFWRKHMPHIMPLLGVTEDRWPSIPDEKGKIYLDRV